MLGCWGKDGFLEKSAGAEVCKLEGDFYRENNLSSKLSESTLYFLNAFKKIIG